MIRFFNGRVLSLVNGMDIREDEVWVDGNRIYYMGPQKAEMPEFEREIDLKGDLLMPGFKNAHTHSAMTFLRSMADDMPLQTWLTEQVFPKEAMLTPDMVYIMTKLAIMEYVSSGITASFDMYFKNDAYVKANTESGFRTVICSAFNNFDKDPTAIEEEYLKFNSCHELIGYRLGLHAEYTTSLERIKYIASLIEKYKAPMYVHLAETKSEVEGCIERYGKTPAALFDSLGMYNYGGGGYHCVWMSDEDIEIFKKRKLWAILNPASNLKLASGIAPVGRFLKAGVNMAIGTDGAASNNALDMFREMYLVTALQKYAENDASACPADEVLKMACVGGARAMGLDDCDCIAEGKLADLIVINLRRPNMRPINNIGKNIVYAGSKENVKMTMVNGKVLYEDGEFFIGDSAEDIYSEVEKTMKIFR